MLLALLIGLAISLSSSGEALVRQAVLDAMEQRGFDAAKVEVEVLRVNGVDADAGALRVELSGDATPRARTQVRVVRELPDGGTEAGWALLNVSHFDSIAVLNSGVTSGDRFTLDDVRFEWMEVTAFRGRPLRTSDVELLPSDAVWSRNLAEGRPIRLDDIRLPFAAQTGDPVMMEYSRNGLTLRLPCQARESGAAGDIIRVYSSETRTTYRARLTGPGTATWIETR
jgi:flagella basal body P-ring formation protein FlgA